MDVLFYRAEIISRHEIEVGRDFISQITEKGEPLKEKKILFSKGRSNYVHVWVQTHTNLVKRAGLLNLENKLFAEEGIPSNVKEVLPNTKLGQALESYLEEQDCPIIGFLFEEE